MSDIYADWVHVVPAAGKLKATAKTLLALAGDPGRVRTASNGTEFLVHPEVAQAYNAPGHLGAAVNPFDDPPPAPKRRGRPKQAVKE